MKTLEDEEIEKSNKDTTGEKNANNVKENYNGVGGLENDYEIKNEEERQTNGVENDKKHENKRKKKSKTQKAIDRILEQLAKIKPRTESYMKKRPLITREQWGAREPKEKVELKFPVLKVLFLQTRTEECFNKEDCIKIIQKIQNRDMDERGLPDIQYNFLVGSDKNVYEGRGWAARPDKNEKYPELFDKNIEYAYIGTYDEAEPPEKIQEAAWKLLEDGILFDKMHLRFRVFEDYYQPSGRVDELVKKYVTKEPVEIDNVEDQ